MGWRATQLVGVAGLEPAAPASRRRCSTRLSYTPNGDEWRGCHSRDAYCRGRGGRSPPMSTATKTAHVRGAHRHGVDTGFDLPPNFELTGIADQ